MESFTTGSVEEKKILVSLLGNLKVAEGNATGSVCRRPFSFHRSSPSGFLKVCMACGQARLEVRASQTQALAAFAPPPSFAVLLSSAFQTPSCGKISSSKSQAKEEALQDDPGTFKENNQPRNTTGFSSLRNGF